MKKLLFAAINLHDKPCTIIGGGAVAQRKVKKLIKCGAMVNIIAPEITKAIEKLSVDGAVFVTKRRYQKGDIKGAFLVVIATNDNTANMEALAEAEKLGILINAAFSKNYGNIFFVATKEGDGVTICAMTNDFSPTKSKEFLDEICKNG